MPDLLASLIETVWVGLSAGSMVMTPHIGEDFIQWRSPTVATHLAQEGTPGNSMADAEHWAAGISGPAVAIDDETAITVVRGTVEVVSERQWKHFPS